MEYFVTAFYIVACVLLFSIAIFIHEFGHLVAAKCLGLTVESFSIGFGKVLCKWRGWGIEWRLSLLPFGGYVSLPQVDPEGTKQLQGDAADAVAADIPAWKQIVVAVAGPAGNVVLAVVLAVLLACLPGTRFGELGTEIGSVPAEGPAHDAGLKAGDRVLAVGGHAIATWHELMTEVQITGGKPTPFTVARRDPNGAERTLDLVVTPTRDKASGAHYILCYSVTNTVRAAMWMPVRNPIGQLAWDAGQIFRVLKALVTPKESKAAARSLGGPVMIAEGLYHQVRGNFLDALGFLRFLNVNLAVLNLLPIPVLDGGLVLFALLTLVLRRKPPRRLEEWLTRFFMILLVALMLFLVYRDSVRSWRIHHREKPAAEKSAADKR